MIKTDALVAKTMDGFQDPGTSLARTEGGVIKMPGLMDLVVGAAVEDAQQQSILDDNADFAMPDDRTHLTIKAYLESIPQAWKDEWAGREIQTADWKPPRGTADKITEEIRAFVLSTIPRFDQMMPFREFFLYLEQARRWYEETKDIEITDMDSDEAYSHARRELARMTANSLYALDRYVSIREDGFPKGRKYFAGAPQAYLCWAIDRGNSLALLKGRQAAITSTVMAVLCVIMLMRNNWTGVLLTDDNTKTGEDLFDKKVQGTLKLMPEWITQEYTWDRQSKDNVTLDFREENTKSARRQNFSDLLLLSSDDTQAVNSKTPTVTAYDEAQNIPTFAKIKGEVASTQDANIDGKLMLTRQQLAWGTGTSNPAGKGVFLKEWRSIYRAFMDGEETGGWLPMFFDWTCRPDASLEWYMKKRAVAIQKFKYEGDTSALHIFASAFPSRPDDAFLENHKGVLPSVVIKRFRDRLDALPTEIQPVRGIFKPVYDLQHPTKRDGNADHPYRILGSEFVRARTSLEMLHAPVEMFLPPNNLWLDRNFQGTDPIQSSAGHSNFASTIWDAVGMHWKGGPGCCGNEEPHFHPTVACQLNGRTHDVKEMYTQSVLMGIAYRNHGQRACKELVEWNQGQVYVEYKQHDWIDCRQSLMTRLQLRDIYQMGKSANPFGLHMTNENKARALKDLEELVYNHGHNIRIKTFWSQLVDIELEEKDGRKMWGTRDNEQFKDDVVISTLLSKICCDSIFFHGRRPRLFDTPEAPKRRTRTVARQIRTPLGMRLVPVVQEFEQRYLQ